VRRQHFGCRAH
ncbi:ompA family protein, partial [Vibrio parahaemolyticus V-223/04]